jgi:CxxC motif-containing protein
LSRAAGTKIDDVTQGPMVNARLETTVQGVFACGNVLHVHDLVDNVSLEAHEAGSFAADYILHGEEDWGEAVRPKIPEKTKCALPEGRDEKGQMICIGCPVGCLITAQKKEDGSFSITGNSCKKGEAYARNEMTAPMRTVTSIIRVHGGVGAVVPVKTASEIPKGKIDACMKEIKMTVIEAPVKVGDVLIENVAGTSIAIIATGNMNKEPCK